MIDQRLKVALLLGESLCREGRQIIMPGVRAGTEALSPIVTPIGDGRCG